MVSRNTRVRHERVMALMTLVGETYALPLCQRRRHLAEGARRLLDGDVAVVLRIDDYRPGGRNRVVEVAASGWTEDERKRYLASIAASQCGDPVVRRLWNFKGVRTFRRRDLVVDNDWYRDPWTREVHLPASLDGGVYSVRPDAWSPLTDGIGVRRAPKARAFSDEDCALLHLLNSEGHRLFRPAHALSAQATEHLSPRERQTLERLCSGMSEKEIAADLGLRPSTVHTYVKGIYATLRVSSRAELMARCLTSPR